MRGSGWDVTRNRRGLGPRGASTPFGVLDHPTRLSGGRSGKGGTTTGYLLSTLRVGFGQGVRQKTSKLRGQTGRLSYVEGEHRTQLKNCSVMPTRTLLLLLLLAFGKFTPSGVCRPEKLCSIGRGRSGCWPS